GPARFRHSGIAMFTSRRSCLPHRLRPLRDNRSLRRCRRHGFHGSHMLGRLRPVSVLAMVLAARMTLALRTTATSAPTTPVAIAAMAVTLRAFLVDWQTFELTTLDVLSGQFFDGGQALFIAPPHQHEGVARAPRPACAADAMHVIVGVERHVE